MALELTDGSIFLHLPRTGGTYVTAVLRKLGLVRRGIGLKHDCPGVVPMDMLVPHHVFLRHPYDWIKSVYGWQAGNKWPQYPKPKEGRWWHPFRELRETPEKARSDFSMFVMWVMAERPGFVTRTFAKFADWPCSKSYRFLDANSIEDHTREMCVSLGAMQGHIEGAIEACRPARNATKIVIPDISEWLYDDFCESERIAIERWML